MLKNIFRFNQRFLHASPRCRKFSCSSRTNGITSQKLGSVTAIEINRTEEKNKLDEESFKSLQESLLKFEADNSSSAALIYGIGGNFCSGCVENYKPDPLDLISNITKPIIASITGYATGFGFELALLCDLRVMEETSQMGLNSYPHPMSQAAYERLVALVGLSHAMDLALTGRNVHHREAQQIGLVNRIVDCGTGVGQALQLAKTVGKYPIENLKASKAAVLAATSVR